MHELQQQALAAKDARTARRKQLAYDRRLAPAETSGRVYLNALRQRAKEKGFDFDLTENWLAAKMMIEFCEATGLRFEGAGNDPFGLTIDRRDNSKGYTMANCWATCWIYNRCKSNSTHEDVMRLALALTK